MRPISPLLSRFFSRTDSLAVQRHSYTRKHLHQLNRSPLRTHDPVMAVLQDVGARREPRIPYSAITIGDLWIEDSPFDEPANRLLVVWGEDEVYVGRPISARRSGDEVYLHFYADGIHEHVLVHIDSPAVLLPLGEFPLGVGLQLSLRDRFGQGSIGVKV